MNSTSLSLSSPLLEDYAALEYILLGDLRDLLEEPADAVTRRWLLAVIDMLLNTLPRKAALQAEDGYMFEVLEQYPNWSDQVDELRREKQAVFAKLRHLRDRLNEKVPFEAVASEVRTSLRDWMARLTAHYRHERRIVQTAFNLEVGTGD